MECLGNLSVCVRFLFFNDLSRSSLFNEDNLYDFEVVYVLQIPDMNKWVRKVERDFIWPMFLHLHSHLHFEFVLTSELQKISFVEIVFHVALLYIISNWTDWRI